MSINIVELDHVQVTVPWEKEDACKHFYGQILGLVEIQKPENLRVNGGAWYRIGMTEMHLSPEDAAGSNLESKRHICYVVHDLAAAEFELRQFGVEIIPDKQPILHWKRFYVRDPSGNRVEIAQRL